MLLRQQFNQTVYVAEVYKDKFAPNRREIRR